MAGDENEWVRVPRVPTPKMIDATWDEDLDAVKYESHNTRNLRIYAAMLAAAPTPEDGRWGALAELLAADKAYDEARAALENRDPHLKKLADVGAMIDRLEWAKERRANALAQADRQVEHVCPFCNQLAHMGPCDAQRHGGK